MHPHYEAKVEMKGRTQAELRRVKGWLTGFDETALERHLAAGTTFEQIADPLMQKLRYLDKLVDELARGKPIEKVLRA